MTDTSTEPDTGTQAPDAELANEDADELRTLATLFIDVLAPFASAMAGHLHAQEERLGGREDEEALEATRASCTGNIQEILSMLRANIPAAALETPQQAVAWAKFLRHKREVGYGAVTAAYQYGVAMFRDVLALELGERVEDEEQIKRISVAADEFLFTYIGTILERLLKEFDSDSEPWRPSAEDEVLANGESQEAAKKFRDERVESGEWLADSPEESGAHAESERVLEEFVAIIEDAAKDEELSRRLALGETTAEVVLADEPDLSVTLMLDRTPIEVHEDPEEDAEITLRIASFDLEHLCTEHAKLAMAIARGRVGADGPVRKLLRVAPVMRPLKARYEAHQESERQAGSAQDAETEEHLRVTEHIEDEEDGNESSFTVEQKETLDQASEYELHYGAMDVEEKQPGDFWSVQCVDVHKAFGGNRVLNGLNLGIPEGMITTILGPSGTGKSVLINHLIGLMFPDHGDILVHGRSVPERRRSELFKMRRDFGILFQDGALFGSMNVYDNVAFPLREQTDKSEDEIQEIVDKRLDEVGLTDAAKLTPSEISGGMKKRAGFARALVLEPKIVMFDEPDSGLDPVRTALLCDLIRKVHGEHGGTYIVITHDVASARRLGDYIAVLWKGRIVESGDAERMFNSENPFVRQFLGGTADGPLGME